MAYHGKRKGPKGPGSQKTKAAKNKKVPAGYHRMPNGKLMKGSKHKGKK